MSARYRWCSGSHLPASRPAGSRGSSAGWRSGPGWPRCSVRKRRTSSRMWTRSSSRTRTTRSCSLEWPASCSSTSSSAGAGPCSKIGGGRGRPTATWRQTSTTPTSSRGHAGSFAAVHHFAGEPTPPMSTPTSSLISFMPFLSVAASPRTSFPLHRSTLRSSSSQGSSPSRIGTGDLCAQLPSSWRRRFGKTSTHTTSTLPSFSGRIATSASRRGQVCTTSSQSL
mmetsp:Transcript_21747/g.50824  ORF Transcript_21747/g.50824 Transcript_21747/m.50824 type:complete len:225 (+) Transcript_21747:123-797(+)